MATVGQKLTAAEAGTVRYEQDNSLFSYAGNWTTVGGVGSGGSQVYTADPTASVKYNFTGSTLTILGQTNTTRPPSHTLKVDGVSYTYTDYSTTVQASTVIFSKSDFGPGEHYAEQTYPNVAGSLVGTFDAVDVSGVIKPYNESIKTPSPQASTGGL